MMVDNALRCHIIFCMLCFCFLFFYTAHILFVTWPLADVCLGSFTLFSLPGKVYSRVPERRVRLLIEQCGFCHGRGTLDQLYTLQRVLEGAWEFAQPVHICFVDLEKAYDRVPQGVLWGVLREYGVDSLLLQGIQSLYHQSQNLVRIAVSQTHSQSGLVSAKAVLCHRFCS